MFVKCVEVKAWLGLTRRGWNSLRSAEVGGAVAVLVATRRRVAPRRAVLRVVVDGGRVTAPARSSGARGSARELNL